MPSRRAVAVIALFWLATTALVLYRDWWPRLRASGPPPIAIDLADEASQTVPVRWHVFRGDQRVGSLTTFMRYVEADDSFRFTHEYRMVQLDLAGVRVTIPEVTAFTRVGRGGELREQGLDGSLTAAVVAGPVSLFELKAKAKVRGRVENGLLTGRCEMESPLGAVAAPLEPVAVPAGQVLNPLQPVNRLANVRPGLRWVVPEVNPLQESVAALVREQAGRQGVQLPARPPAGDLIAEVLADPETLDWNGTPSPCWVIEYRGDEARARSWVRVSDGKVIRQEAFGFGERVALERQN